MYLFIDTISETNTIILYNKARSVVDQGEWRGAHQEFEMLNTTITEILDRNDVSYKDMEGVTLIHGPGGFTGTRVTSLVANSLLHFANIPLQAFSYFDILEIEEAGYPHQIMINKREYLQKKTKEEEISLEKNRELPLIEGSCNTTAGIDLNEKIGTIYTNRDYTKIIQDIEHKHKKEEIQPIYAKDPNITIKSYA